MLGYPIPKTTDVADVLPEAPAEKFRRLRDSASASYGMLRVTLDLQQELREAKQTADQRRRFLKAPPTGKVVADDHPDYVATQKTLDRTVAELLRQQGIQDGQAAIWNARAGLVRDVEAAVRDAVGRLCVITAVEVKLPALKKGEAILDAIEARRRRGRELVADLNRVQSAPIKSAEAKRKMRAQIDVLAERGKPYTAGVVERGSEIEFADTQKQALARGEHTAHVGWVEPDTMATFVVAAS